MSRVGSTVLLLTLALLALAGVPLLGRAALVPAGLFLLLAALRALRPAERGWGGWGAVIAGLVGGSIGVAGARAALAGFGGATPCSARRVRLGRVDRRGPGARRRRTGPRPPARGGWAAARGEHRRQPGDGPLHPQHLVLCHAAGLLAGGGARRLQPQAARWQRR